VAAVLISVIQPLQSFAQTPSLSPLSTATVPESVVVSSSASAPDALVAVEQGGNVMAGSRGAGIGVKLGTLGVGIQGAVAVANRVNVRGGFNVFNYDHNFDQSGQTVAGSLKLQSVEANLDLLIGGGFRFSPGVLLYNNNHVDGTITVASGTQFSIGGQNYTSGDIRTNNSNPITGTASMTFNKFSPMLAIGFGQLVPRSGRHFSVQFDLGVVFEDAPTVTLDYGGTGCISPIPPGASAAQLAQLCQPIKSQLNITTQIASEQQKFSDAVSILKYYPILSLGFGWRF
jgi:hypothetical protein